MRDSRAGTTPRVVKTVRGIPPELIAPPELRVGLTERELRFWIERLRAGGRSARLVSGEIERAVDAALKAGLVLL